MDNISSQVSGMLGNFNSQELANLLYAFASADRADVYFFDQLANQLVQNMKNNKPARSGQHLSQPKPQEFR